MVQKAHKDLNSAKHPEVPEGLKTHPLTGWIQKRGWQWFDHQVENLNAVQGGSDTVVFAPTGSGKTLTGFLPTFLDLAENPEPGKLHTIYISPLKALAVDIHRNIEIPVQDLKLPVTYETRTGDTPQSRRKRQKENPPDILMTTPESLALLLSYDNAAEYFSGLKYIIIDELHSLIHTKRGDLLALGLSRMNGFSPDARRIGLSATLEDQDDARNWLCRHNGKIITADAALKPEIEILQAEKHIPWSGHGAGYAINDLYARICKANLSIVFVNTRAQAEIMLQQLWQVNEKDLKIGIHHGSLERELRREVESRMANGTLDCVVATGSLDMGLDWGDVDLVVQVGAPKGVSRLLQRIGRSNHRLDSPSQAILVPTNRFEYIEALAACQEAMKGNLDGITPKSGGLDVLAQHVFGVACHGPFDADDLYHEVRRAWPYNELSEQEFYDVLNFVKDGGYALKNYQQFSRLVIDEDGRYRLRSQKDISRYRMNIGTIIDAPHLKVQLGRRYLGTVEEAFVQNLAPGDSFMFGGQLLQFDKIMDTTVVVSKSKDAEAKIPNYAGGRMPLSTHLSYAVRKMIGHSENWHALPDQVRDWLALHQSKSELPDENTLLVETFPRQKKHFMVVYTFAGRNANQTLGFLLLRRLKRQGARPISFNMTDYSLAVWSYKKPENIESLFDPDLMYDDFNEWMEDTPLLKRLFRDAALISGLVERRYPGQEKTGRQILMSTDLIFDVLMKYEPHHVLIRTSKEDAMRGLIDAGRLNRFLHDMKGKIRHIELEKVSPMAVPLILQINRESLSKEDLAETLLEDMENEILAEASIDQID